MITILVIVVTTELSLAHILATVRITVWKVASKTLQKALGTRSDMSTAYHPQTDGQITIRVFEALYGRKCRSPVLWAEIGEGRLIRPELVQKTTDKVVLIKEKLKAARDRQKSYVDNRRKPLEFEVGDQVLLKVSAWKGMIRFGKKGKLAPSLHDIFHVSNLKKCLADANLHVPLDEIKINKTFHFVEEPIEIMDRKVKSLKRSKILIVKLNFGTKFPKGGDTVGNRDLSSKFRDACSSISD
ncbi:hypothetical protein Tco_0371218 [Tanacetum coccineum]